MEILATGLFSLERFVTQDNADPNSRGSSLFLCAFLPLIFMSHFVFVLFNFLYFFTLIRVNYRLIWFFLSFIHFSPVYIISFFVLVSFAVCCFSRAVTCLVSTDEVP